MGPTVEGGTSLYLAVADEVTADSGDELSLPLLSVVLVNYNGREHLPACLSSLFQQTYPRFDVTIVDNASSDDSIEYVRAHFPQVRIVENNSNLGFGRANNVGIEASQGEYVVFTNYDVEFDPQWLAEMVRAVQSAPDVGIVAPKILLFGQRDRVNACGLTVQYTGYAFSRGYLQPANAYIEPESIASATGCALLIPRRVLNEVGAFDPLFQELGKDFYRSSLEDVDLSWRVQLAGYRVLLQPSAALYHKYVPKELSAIRFEYLEGGRWLLLLKNYGVLTLVILVPALLLSELIAWGGALIGGPGHIAAKARTYGWLASHAKVILDRRMATQRQRMIDDLPLLERFGTDTRFGRFFPGWFLPGTCLANGVNVAFRLYYRVAKWLLTLAGQRHQTSQEFASAS